MTDLIGRGLLVFEDEAIFGLVGEITVEMELFLAVSSAVSAPTIIASAYR